LMFFAPLLWRPRAWLTGSFVVLGMGLAIFPLWNHLGLINQSFGKTPVDVRPWYYLLQVAVLTAGGLHLLALAAAEAWRGRNLVSLTLALWIIGGFFSATILNFAINARSLLLIVPPAAILLVRRLDAIRGNATMPKVMWPLIPAAAVAWSLALADCHLANSARTAAEEITMKYKPAGHQVWFEGHGAFQYYMEKAGALPIDVEQSLLKPGDVLVVSEIGILTPVPRESVGWLGRHQSAPVSWMNLMGGTESGTAGFYGANFGPVPFAIGKLPTQNYYVVKVFARVQYKSRATNPEEVRQGYVPVFAHHSAYVTGNFVLQTNAETAKQFQVAHQLEVNGQVAEAIQKYLDVLNADPTNAEAMNHLAWVLATTGKPELRNGAAAVRLAGRAVELTDSRMPLFMTTLAAAYAETGQFPKAIETAENAYALAIVTSQKDIAAENVDLLYMYNSGNPVVAVPTP